MKALTARAFILAGLCALAVPAQATEFSITFRGKVSEGTDAAGIFGAAGANLTGLDYLASFTFDSDVFAIYDREHGSDFDYEGYNILGPLRSRLATAPISSPMISMGDPVRQRATSPASQGQMAAIITI